MSDRYLILHNRQAETISKRCPMLGAAQLITPQCGIVLSDPNDEKAMAQAMRDLLANPAQCKAMGKAARAIAEHQNWLQMAQDYWELYAEFTAKIH